MLESGVTHVALGSQLLCPQATLWPLSRSLCRNSECPEYRLEKKYDDYEVGYRLSLRGSVEWWSACKVASRAGVVGRRQGAVAHMLCAAASLKQPCCCQS